MKKYLAGILLIAAFAVIGGLKFFSTEQRVLAAPTCNPNGFPKCEGTTYQNCLNVTQPDGSTAFELSETANSPLCGAITVGGGGVTSGVTISKSLNPNTTYYWRVIAGNAFGKSEPSKTFSFKTGGKSVTGIAGPSVITTGVVSSAQNFYSLLSTVATWQNAAGAVVSPKTIKQEVVYTDENNQRVYPKVGSQALFNYLQSSVIGPGTDQPGSPLPACGSSNVNQVSGGFRCCKDGNSYSWFTNWTGTAEQCAAISAGGSSVGTSVQ